MKPVKNICELIAERPCVFIHKGDNSRRGSVFVFESINDHVVQFKEVYCASKNRLYTDVQPKSVSYSIRNLERRFLSLDAYESEHDHIFTTFAYCPIQDISISDIGGQPQNQLNKIKTQARRLFCAWLDSSVRLWVNLEIQTDAKIPTNTKGKQTMSINLKTAAAIVDETTTSISVEIHSRQGVKPEAYTYLCTQELTIGLEPGDLVLVDSAGGLGVKVAKVVEVHTEPQVDLNSDIEYRWAFQQVAQHTVNDLKERHNRIHDLLKEKQRFSTRQSVMANLGMTQDDLKLLN